MFNMQFQAKQKKKNQRKKEWFVGHFLSEGSWKIDSPYKHYIRGLKQGQIDDKGKRNLQSLILRIVARNDHNLTTLYLGYLLQFAIS